MCEPDTHPQFHKSCQTLLQGDCPPATLGSCPRRGPGRSYFDVLLTCSPLPHPRSKAEYLLVSSLAPWKASSVKGVVVFPVRSQPGHLFLVLWGFSCQQSISQPPPPFPRAASWCYFWSEVLISGQNNLLTRLPCSGF